MVLEMNNYKHLVVGQFYKVNDWICKVVGIDDYLITVKMLKVDEIFDSEISIETNRFTTDADTVNLFVPITKNVAAKKFEEAIKKLQVNFFESD